MKITLAKALKMKNRLVKEIQMTSNLVSKYNSVMDGQERPIDISETFRKREKLVDSLVSLKTAITFANAPIQTTIYLMSELKNDLIFLNNINTNSGISIVEDWTGSKKENKTTSILDFNSVKELAKEVENNIDHNQDILDKHNHTVEIEISDELFNLIER